MFSELNLRNNVETLTCLVGISRADASSLKLKNNCGRVVVVEHLDGLADGRDLLGAHLLALGPLGLLLCALRAEVAEESLRLRDFGLRVLEVVLGLHDLNVRIGLNF